MFRSSFLQRVIPLSQLRKFFCEGHTAAASLPPIDLLCLVRHAAACFIIGMNGATVCVKGEVVVQDGMQNACSALLDMSWLIRCASQRHLQYFMDS